MPGPLDYSPDEFPMNLSSIEDYIEAMINNSTYDSWSKDWSVLNEDTWQTVIITLYSVAIVFGFFANMLVVVVIARYKQLHTVTNVFIGYLALADVSFCIFNMPLQLHYQLRNDWIFGKVLCYVGMPTFGVPFFSSTLAIMMIAVDRYILIVYPFKKRMTTLQAVLSVIAIILLTVALTTPVIAHIRFVQFTDIMGITKTFCYELWPNYRDKQVYSVSIFLLQFVMPMSLTSFFYKHICQVLKNRPFKKHDTRRNQRTNRILIAVVLTFTLCWLPLSIFALLAEFSQRIFKGKYFLLVDLLLKLFAMGSACINPFLYGWLNDNFKKELGRLFGYRLCWSRGRGTRATSYSRTTDINNGITLKSEMCLKGMQQMCVRQV